ncbi:MULTISPECIES: hydrolase [Halomicrobium]|uniref:Glycoside hydrolase family 2 sugar binding n=2 Tax=Halomicrobium mukohataei TaxID=57705 RepID=C7P1U3_HALMD|nr:MULTISPECIES: hydrolase [Halomicrobium]ACV49183.1 glycoside hydrolase family 2 sugar binding [Halomicrobium mukohataei DSM 12286]QCD64588.1 hydrolase [Halomicrobium mukohataei]QFR19395.1 hydrolase [Halomicrobium sp. ZPS1]
MSLEWSAGAVDPGGDPPSAETWQPIDVPGRPTEFVDAEAVAYRATFEDPRDPAQAHAVLVLEGVYAHARVWLDGELIAEHDAYFEPLRVPLPVGEDNELLVECRRPEDRFGGIYDTDRVPTASSVPGIWWDARIETHPDPYVADLNVAPRVDGESTSVEVEATVVTDEPLDDRLTLSLRPTGEVRGGGMMNRARVDTDAGRATVTHEIDVRDPSLWWPHDVGSQPRYAVRAKLADDERTVETGLRSVSYDESGLLVNGQRVPARGVTLVDGTVEDVRRAVDANANLVRAHAHALSPAVYEACDEQGVLVWQDLPLTGPGGFDADRAAALLERLVWSRRRHPSLAAVSVHDGPIPDYADGLGSGLLDRVRFRWRAWRADYDGAPAGRVADGVTEVPAFPVVGPAGIDPDAATMYPGWTFGEARDAEWLCDRYGLGTVVAAFGAGALANGDDEATDFEGERRAARVDGGVDDSQAMQASVVGTVAETLRRRDADVLAVDTLRDADGAGMGVLAEDGTPKAAFERLQSAYEPTQVLLADPTPGDSEVVLVHDRPTGGLATVEWDVDGDREQTEVEIEAYGRQTVTTIAPPAGSDVTLAVAIDDVVARNRYTV